MQTNLQGKLGRYANDFLFQKTYDVGYLPSIEPRSDREAAFLTFLNGAIATVVLLNLLLACRPFESGLVCWKQRLRAMIVQRSSRSWSRLCLNSAAYRNQLSRPCDPEQDSSRHWAASFSNE